MEAWIELFEATGKKLDRELTEQEVSFLKWLSEKHLNELQEKTDEEQDENIK